MSGSSYDATALDIGMGLHLNLIGQGQGRHYATAVARYGSSQLGEQRLRVTIATFNLRAQRLWQRLGFEPVEQFCKTGSHQTFVIMVGEIAG
ncbi:MAG: GNAT family protein [Cyanobacteria bacterium P01_D01_bin.115]